MIDAAGRNGAHPGSRRLLAGIACGVLALACLGSAAAQDVPLPRPRPPRLNLPPITIPLPRPRPGLDGPDQVTTVPESSSPAESKAVETPMSPEPSACLRRLGPQLAIVQPIPPVTGPGECGINDPVQLAGIVTRSNSRIAIVPPATLRCEMAEAIVHWVRDEAEPAAAELGAGLTEIANFASFDCRGRNRIVGAKLSEHGHGNALDIRAFKLTNGTIFEPTDATVSKDTRERLKRSVCSRFTTVLGPGSDGFHENHIHVDLAERRGGFRLCQWVVRDPADLPPPLPRERPSSAPPRADDEPAVDPPSASSPQVR